ncbi:MAG: CYTH domain-containing protein [Candidatus Azobacteroides sp.]|nr:CYTH domain-containing protein [Candidatus Azobacteroides sp.]
MPSHKETERKFLVQGSIYRQLAKGKYYCQAYLNDDPERAVRVRIIEDTAFLTIKGKNISITHPEYEYKIPLSDAQFMIDNLCIQPVIEKIRYRIPQGELIWEVDEFLGDNKGLVVAELELPEENYPFIIPAWIGKEVTSEGKYYNINLIKHPYKDWKKL